MMWCLIGLAILAALTGLAALLVRRPRPQLSQVHPGRMLRGCVAIMSLLAALGLVGLALLVSQR
jgi:hypothetical protein